MNIKDLVMKAEHAWIHISHTIMWIAVIGLTILAWYGIRDFDHTAKNMKVIYQNELTLRDSINIDRKNIVDLENQNTNLQHELDVRNQVQSNIIKALTIHAKELAQLNALAQKIQKEQNHNIYLQEGRQ